MNCVSLSVGIIFRYEKVMCIFSFFRKMKIERSRKLKLIAYIQGITCYKMSLIEASNVAFHKAKKKRAGEVGRIIFRPTVYITYDQNNI